MPCNCNPLGAGVERAAQAGQAATETGWRATGGACQPATGGEEKVSLGTGASQLDALGALEEYRCSTTGKKAMNIGVNT